MADQCNKPEPKPDKDFNATSPSSSGLLDLLESFSLMFFCIDPKARLMYVSKSAAALWGYESEQLIGTPFLDIVVEQNHARTFRYLNRMLSGGQESVFFNYFQKEDGSTMLVSWSSRWDAHDQMLYCMIKDIMEEKEPGEQEQSHHIETTAVLERIADGFLALDHQWRITYWNKEAEHILGSAREEVLGKNLWDCFSETVGTIVFEQFQKVAREQIPVHFEFYNKLRNIWFDINAYPSNGGISVYFRNVNERKEAEEEMSKLSMIVKETDNLVMLCDTNGTIKWINEAFVQKTGYTQEEAIGKRPGDLLEGPETDQQAIERARKKYRKGQAFHEELLFYTKNKEKFWVALTGQPIFDEMGNIKELFSIQTDVTERKQLQDQLYKEREIQQRNITAAVIQAQEKERAQVGRELHDNVNQVLTTVKLYNELCRDGIGNTNEIMGKSIKLLQDSIDEIRLLSRQLSATSLDQNTLSESIKGLIDTVAATNKICITLQMGKVEQLELNPEMHLAVYRILQEHLTNILKHAAAEMVFIEFDYSDDSLRLKVKDDGKGFDVGRKRNGIGITNMMTRAEYLCGQLTIDSSPGMGCTLQVSFPMVE